MWVYSNDNITIGQRQRELPAKHWEVTGPNEGVYHDLDPTNAATFGWSELVEVPRPDADHVKTVLHDGTAWVETWTYDSALAEANVMHTAATTEREAIQSMVSALTDIVEADTLTEAEQTEALKKLARICRLAVDMV